MFPIPIDLAPIPYPVHFAIAPIPDLSAFGAGLPADLSIAFAIWLGLAAVVNLALLPLAFRQREPKVVETTPAVVVLPKAA